MGKWEHREWSGPAGRLGMIRAAGATQSTRTRALHRDGRLHSATATVSTHAIGTYVVGCKYISARATRWERVPTGIRANDRKSMRPRPRVSTTWEKRSCATRRVPRKLTSAYRLNFTVHLRLLFQHYFTAAICGACGINGDYPIFFYPRILRLEVDFS